MSDSRPENTIPEIVRVLPHPDAKLHIDGLRRVFRVMLGIGIVFGAFAVISLFGPLSRRMVGPIPFRYLCPICTLIALSPLYGIARANRRFVEEWRKEVDASARDECSHPLGQQLRVAWHARRRCPNPSRIKKIVEAAPRSERPTLIVMGMQDMPEIGDRFFEPIVFSPGEIQRSSGFVLWMGIAFLAIAALAYFGIIPSLARFPLQQGIINVVLGTVLLFFYVAFRPTYLRFAPGRIQFIRYAMLRRRTPIIEDYSMGPGVVAIVHSDIFPPKHFRELVEKKRSRTTAPPQPPSNAVSLLLYRNGRWRSISTVQMGKSKSELIDAFWSAVLSTARQPELGDTLSV
ncbi:MAG: hypothetical protein H6819_04125 [Phycisphaerales bacterium]|nr:hypothetical protein [Phycisphaerales bacterium]MCB9856386.1 hypothetical protein [Phycisphaerales bacterium]